jgi:DeoR family transcriptional regulator, fructose operon transcriptional repressor
MAAPRERSGPVRLPAGRKAQIATFVSEHEQVTVAQLAEYFDVSADTVRRDLDQLAADNLVVRTHGGAVSVQAMASTEKRLDIRLELQFEAKERIGVAAAAMIPNNSVVMINAGTTPLALVRALGDHRGLTIATNNLRIPAEIDPGAVSDFYMFGGSVRLNGQVTIGPVRIPQRTGGFLAVRSDVAVISVGSVTTDGFFTSHAGEAAMMNEMMASAAQVMILADSTKFGTARAEPGPALFAQLAELNAADVLVTDEAPDAELTRALTDAGVEIIVADRVASTTSATAFSGNATKRAAR